jgi:nitroreductase
MSKRANPDHPILDVVAERWSPYGYDPRPMPATDLESLFEAARWAASAFNEQPWRYLVATRDDEEKFSALLSCLVEANQQWAQNASALVITVVSLNYAHNGKLNGTALHDVGLAAATLTTEATSRGLMVHQMAGILPDKARELFGIPDGFQAVTAMAIGYAADPSTLPDEIRERDTTPRQRRPLTETVFAGAWGQAADLAR